MSASAAEVVVDGEFAPPSVARAVVPIRIVGNGSLSVTPGGLRVRGIKEKSQALLTGALYLAVLVSFLAVIVVSSVLPGGESTRLQTKNAAYLAFAVAAGVGFAGSQVVRRKKREASERTPEPVDWLIPFTSIKRVAREEECALVTIKKFKPSGGLYFVPGDWKAMGELEQKLAAQGVKV